MRLITLTLSERFQEWCSENRDKPDEPLVSFWGHGKVELQLDDDAFAILLDRVKNEGCSLAELLIARDEFVTDIEIK